MSLNYFSDNIKCCLTVLKSDGIIGIPTDSVYGLAANPYSSKAVEKMNIFKNRPSDKSYVLQVHSPSQLQSLIVPIKANLFEKILSYWPGELTVIFKKHPDCAIPNTGETIAVRIPRYVFTLELLKAWDKPLAVTSLNRSSEPPISDYSAIPDTMEMELDYCVANSTPLSGISTTIIDVTTEEPCVIRQGAIYFT